MGSDDEIGVSSDDKDIPAASDNNFSSTIRILFIRSSWKGGFSANVPYIYI
jgi:hypothetical protein